MGLSGNFGKFRPRLLLALLILVNFSYHGLYATQRHLAFETGAFDLGVYAQPLWNFLQGHNFAVSLMHNDGPLRWANHVEPILFLVLPIYRLWPGPLTLLWLQVAALSLAAVPLYALASRRLGNEWPALVIVAAFFLMPATQAVTLFDFHAVSMAPLFLLSAIFFLERALAARGKSLWLWPEVHLKPEDGTHSARKAYLLSALFFLLALATKEDISLHVFMIGLYLLLLRRRWGEGMVLVGLGLLWFYVAFQVVIPAFRSGGQESIFMGWFETLGNTPLEVALSPLTAPDKVGLLLFRADNLPALGMITLPLALLPWLGLPFLAMAGPSLAFVLLGDNPTLRQLETWHYATPMLPFVMLATIDGLARLTWWLGGAAREPANSGAAEQPFQEASRGSGGAGERPWPTQYAIRNTHHVLRFTFYVLHFIPPTLLLLTALIYHHFRGYSPFSRLQEWPEVTVHHDLGRTIAGQIPPEASVLAQAQLVPYVAHRYNLAIWDGPLKPDYDYIWLDLSHPKLPNRFNAHGELLTGLIIEHEFGPIVAEDGYLLLKKGATRDPLPESLFTFTEFQQLPAGAQPVEAMFGDSLKLVGVKTEVRRLATSETEPQVVFYFEVIKKPAEDYQLFLYRLNAAGEIKGATDYAQPALFWWPTSRWEAGDRRQVRVNTIPWWTGDQQLFGYAAGLTRNNDPWVVEDRLPVTISENNQTPSGRQPIDEGTLLPVAAFRRLAGLAYPVPLTSLSLENSEWRIANGE